MPNWCHCTLSVSGDPLEVQMFRDAARPREESIRRAFDENTIWIGEKPTWEDYLASVRAEQPLSFDAILPQPGDEELAAFEKRVECICCAGTGRRPLADVLRFCDGTTEKAEEWYMRTKGCNGCAGTGQSIRTEGWYAWRLANWGCKWDASFGEPFMAFGSEDSNVEATTEALGVTDAEGVAVYKFDTPWAPPIPVVHAAAEQHPGLEFVLRYGEPGEGYAGEVRAHGAEVEESELAVEDVLAPEEMWF